MLGELDRQAELQTNGRSLKRSPSGIEPTYNVGGPLPKVQPNSGISIRAVLMINLSVG